MAVATIAISVCRRPPSLRLNPFRMALHSTFPSFSDRDEYGNTFIWNKRNGVSLWPARMSRNSTTERWCS